MNAHTNTEALICSDDRYCPTGDTFASVEEFLSMCSSCFGDAPTLTERIGCGGSAEYVTADGVVVLRAA